MSFLFVGRTADSVRDDMVLGPAGIRQAFPPHQRPQYIASQSCVRFHTGAIAYLASSEEPRKLQGKNSAVTWLDEFSTYRYPEETWSQVVLSTRVDPCRIYVTTNSMPPSRFLERLIAEKFERGIHVTQSSSFDNFANLPPKFQTECLELIKTPLGRAWILGIDFRPEGALWKSTDIRRAPEAPPRGKTIISVDPATRNTYDETGIVVLRRAGNKAYVLDDRSGHHDSNFWPTLVAQLVKQWGASEIIVETTMGGGLLEGLIRSHDKRTPIREVNTHTGKDDRAYPVAHQYNLGNVFHVGIFSDLEEQMLTWDPSTQEEQRGRKRKTSPDRLDALVHGVTALGLTHLTITPNFVPLPDDFFPESRL